MDWTTTHELFTVSGDARGIEGSSSCLEQPAFNRFYLVALDHTLEVELGGSALDRVNE